MADNRTMGQRGFTETTLTDHEFAALMHKHHATYRQHLIGTVWEDKDGNSLAVVTYDNEACTRRIFLKDKE